MRGKAEPLLLPILAWILLTSPLGEGGATPAALLAIQSAVIAGAILVLLFRPHRSQPGIRCAILGIAAAYLCLGLLSSWGTPYPYASFLRCLDLAILLGVLILARLGSWTERQRIFLGDCFLAAASLQAVGVLIGAIRGDVASFVERHGLLNTNHEAAYLLTASLVGFPAILRPGRVRVRGSRMLGIGLILAAFVLLQSRGALLGLAAGATASLALHWPRLSSRARVVAFSSAGFILFLSAAALAIRFHSSEDPYRFERVRIWAADLRCFADHPYLGVGPGLFRHLARQYNFPLVGPVQYGRFFETPHSDYLGFLLEAGLPGLALVILLLILIFKALLVARRGGDPLAEGLFCACAALAAHALVEDLSTRPAIAVAMVLLAGVTLPRKHRMSSSARRPRGVRWIASGALSLFWWLAVLNPYLAFSKDQLMRRSSSFAEMDQNFRDAVRLNPFQAPTYLFPVEAFLAARPEVPLSLDLHGRFRRDLDDAERMDRLSADQWLHRGREETRAFRSLFHDAATRDRVLGDYRRAIGLAPHDPRIRVELALFLGEIGRGGDAVSQLRLALREEPNYLGCQVLLTRLLLAQADRGAALQSWKRVAEIRSSLASYRPDSSYAGDIARDPWTLRESLGRELGPS